MSVKISDLWNEEFYNEIITNCANTCTSCKILKDKLGQPFENLTEEEQYHFYELYWNTLDRLNFDL